MNVNKCVVAAVLGLVLAALVQAEAPPPLEAQSVLGGRVSLLVPRGFVPLTEELLKVKYPTAYRPTLAYSNERASVNIAIGHTAQALRLDQVGAAHQALSSQFKAQFPTAQWFASEVKTINGRQFFVLELRTPAADTEVRNIMAGTSLDDRLLLISFNVTKALEPEWIAAGHKIIESIRVK